MYRKLQTYEQINGGTNVLLSKTDYNEVGQVLGKHLHSTNGGSSFLQDIAYAYNERGWLAKINDPINDPATARASNKLFAEQLNYNLTQYGAQPQFNGNIAEQVYNGQNSQLQNEVYAYDSMNRLTRGTSSAGYSETPISYDNMGNIVSLTRNNFGTLGYGYSGNQLTSITGFKSGSYGYDPNGNVQTENTSLNGTATNNTYTYNLLNLPQTITGTVNLSYVYDAAGTKLRKISNGSPTDYIGGIQYKPDAATIDFIQTEEGRAINLGSSYNYEYTLTDHLGNNRVTFDMVNGKVGEDEYYPFGLNAHLQVNAGNNYLYNKKELQPELVQYDYGARFYDPVIARWTAVDPVVEKDRRWSPYNYGRNNPIRNIDPDGMDIIETAEGTTYTGSDIAPELNKLKSQQQNDPPKNYNAFLVTGGMTLEEMLSAAGVRVATNSGGFFSLLETGPKSIATLFASMVFLSGDNITQADRERFESNAIQRDLNNGDPAAAQAEVKAWNADKRNANDRIVFRYMSTGEFLGIRKGPNGNFLDPIGKDGLFSEKYITPDLYTSGKTAQDRLALPSTPHMAVWTFESAVLPTKQPAGAGVYNPVMPANGQNGGGNEATISQPLPIVGGFTLNK